MIATLLWLCALAPIGAQAAGALRCDGGIISEGDRVADLLGACGEPAYRDSWYAPTRNPHLLNPDTEEWYYNFGANQLLRVVRVRGGHVGNIGSDGYGFDQAPQPPCDTGDIVPGMSKFRLLLTCGPPVTQEARTVLRALDPDDPYDLHHRGEVTPVYREEWVYNFGGNALMRIVTLENGRVTDVENGRRGFD
ncbi:MAG TPA: DUF2845 domain-containing protein [Nevskiaceae bacterium]|nr:DUF2845 domain-containing protein [Nevskiaceae bacterium]